MAKKNSMTNNSPKSSKGATKFDYVSFLNNKLSVYGKFKQTAALYNRAHVDPVRCSTCQKVVFRTVECSYVDDKTGKNFNIKNVCLECAEKYKIAHAALAEVISFYVNGHPKCEIPAIEFKGKCDICGIEDKMHKVWVYYTTIPHVLHLCPDCLPKGNDLPPLIMENVQSGEDKLKETAEELLSALKEID